MATFKYPQNDFDDPDKLLGLLGSFWATTYQGSDLLQDLSSATARMAQQTHLQLLELVASISRFNVPVFHQDNWYPLTVLESEVNTDEGLIAKYTTPSANVYDPTTLLSYGELPSQVFFSVARPTDLHDVKMIFDRVAAPTAEFIAGIDYWLQDSVITFRENPFDNSSIAKADILDTTGAITDRQITLWLYRGQWDWKLVYEQFGYALRLQLESSEGYKTVVNAVFDAFAEGTSIRTQQLTLASAFGVPLAREAEETVETIASDADKLNIITDKHVYQYPLGTTATVAVGDKIAAGDPLTDLFQVFELNRGTAISSADITALTVGSGVLAWGFWGDITFDNSTVATVVEPDVAGYTKISWDLGGFPFDIVKFWEDVHASGVAANETLAMLLDVRPNPVGQPTAASLPTTINPLQFLTDNILRNNAYVVKVKPGSQLAGQLAFVPVDQLRKIQPPHTLMLLIVELAYADSPVIMEGPGTDLAPGYEESVSGFPIMTISESLDPATYIVEDIAGKSISGRCI
tara:strand:+ start:33937 stop:35496 length:1560 start_codon:yes stop_codon:yes gene_type:complete